MLTTMAREASAEITAFVAELDRKEEERLKRQYLRNKKRTKEAKKNLKNQKKKYRAKVQLEEDLVEYFESYNERNKWLSFNALELLRIFSSGRFYKKEMCLYRLPESRIHSSTLPKSERKHRDACNPPVGRFSTIHDDDEWGS